MKLSKGKALIYNPKAKTKRKVGFYFSKLGIMLNLDGKYYTRVVTLTF